MDTQLGNLLNTIYGTGQTVFDFFTKSINTVLANNGIDITIEKIGDWSLFALMFGGGLLLFMAFTLVKWVLDIVL